jgi:hypothetical protein
VTARRLTLEAALLASACAAVATAAPSGAGDTASPPAAIDEIDAGPAAEHLHWGRWDAGPRLDLFVVGGGKVRIWEQAERGFGAAPSAEVELPPEPSLIDFGDLDGDEGEEIVLLNRRGVFLRGREEAAAGSGGAAPASGDPLRLGSFVRALAVGGIPTPLETVRSAVLHDVTGDGKPEIIVPVRGGYELFERRGGRLEKVISFEGEHGVDVSAGGPGILDPLEIEIRIARLKLKDLNGDGRLDVLARTKGTTRAYLQGESGFSGKPSYEIDTSLFKEGGGEKGTTERIIRSSGVKVHEVDIDGDGIQDYLIASGQFLRVYFGEKTGADFSRPFTMLKLSSELQGVGSFDIDGDRRLDLVALKFELPSLPRLIAAYFIASSLDFEVLGYRNEGGRRFARRPSWRNTLTLSIPPLRDVIEGFEEFADRFLEAAARRRRFASGDLDGDGRPDAVFLDDDGVLRTFLAGAGDEGLGEIKLGKILFDAKKSEWELRELLEHVAGASHAAARAAVAGRSPDREVPLGPGHDPDSLEIAVRDLDGDRRAEVVVRWNARKLRVVRAKAP